MPRVAKKEQTEPKAEVRPKKLSKYALWRQKHPNGIGLIIHDMKAVLRQYDTPWWYT